MTFQNAAYLNPRLYGHQVWNDMAVGGTGTNTGTGAATATQGRDGFMDVIRIETGTTTTGAAAIKYANLKLAGGQMWVKMGVEFQDLSTVGEEFMLEVGVQDGNATTVITDGIYFRYNRVSTGVNWFAISESGGTETATDTTIVAAEDTVYDLQVVVNSDATSIGYYIDDVLVATHTTNIPTAANMPNSWNIIKSAGTTERKAYALYYEYIRKRT